ncbi:cell division protein ZapE [Pseudomonas sp. EL_65y_Pfl2_R95]|uniref:cell division protein ZapE n=1 Tax=Pseudomonas sp. EL_65y_Pfl2_R95 TaxID=3088698 RepID=UPI0030DA70F5
MTQRPPLAAYHHAIDQLDFKPDNAQQFAAEQLQACYDALHNSAVDKPAAVGVYLWGPVGRGKTWLMDQFYKSLQVPTRRQHFHHFIRWVHQRMFQLTGTADPLRALACELRDEVRVLCFDELFVNDIGDAIILGKLFQVMFEEGVVLVCTSNQPPHQLYEGGFNRERFLPAIAAIEANMQVVNVDGGQDHRLHPGTQVQRYWLTANDSPSALHGIFNRLSEGQPNTAEAITLNQRHIKLIRHADSVIWCRFADLCVEALGSEDYIALCDRFSTILISDVPCLSGQQRHAKIARGTEDSAQRIEAGDRKLPSLAVFDDSVRRFIALIDECYDRRVPVYIEAAVPLNELYTEGYLEFAFRRTLSRLQEMQLQRFSAEPEASSPTQGSPSVKRELLLTGGAQK